MYQEHKFKLKLVSKNIIIVGLITFCIATSVIAKPIPCGTHEGKNLYKGKNGGCYYLKTKKKVKVYVDNTLCKCK